MLKDTMHDMTDQQTCMYARTIMAIETRSIVVAALEYTSRWWRVVMEVSSSLE